jgi:mono/diheme cytochrome c family protein
LRLEPLAAALAFAAICTLDARAQDEEKLTSGPGAGLTAQKCQICHELAHVTRSRLSRGEWTDTVRLMRERGAPLSDAEIEVILAYLAAYYARDPAPAPAPDTLAPAR